MRYIGSKENLLNFIESVVFKHGITSGVFCDLFAGTTTVGRHFKRKGFQIISNDLMEYTFVFGKAYLENNTPPMFSHLDFLSPQADTLFPLDTGRLEQALAYLNALPCQHGFIFTNYSDVGTAGGEHQRMYFSSVNAGRMDAIRNCIQQWHKAGQISELEFYILLASLLEAIPSVSNTSGTYGAFLKFWEARSKKSLTLTVPPLIYSKLEHRIFRLDGTRLIKDIDCDVLYLDPPYNARQYATNYHVLETVARWDAPAIYGKSGLRPYEREKSAYCRKQAALAALQETVLNARCRLFLLSYSSEGIMPHDAILDILALRGNVTVEQTSYRRYRSDSDHATRQYKPEKLVIERIYVVSSSKQNSCRTY